jgi:methyltransferase (TIGR00027 family)
MSLAGPSQTALGAALMRAIHTRLDRPRLIDDPWADRLVSQAEKTALYERILADADAQTRPRLERASSPQAVIDAALRANPSYAGVILRSRVAEDALREAALRGARQYVLLGAGLDSFALRQPEFARDLAIFEIDHPATQAHKRERLRACGIDVPSNVHFVAADLAARPLAEVLAECGFSREDRAFFSWLGVTIYLSREANFATLRGIAASAAPGSEVVFTYIDQRAFGPDASLVFEERRAVRALRGEAWITGFDPARLGAEIEALGLELVEDLGGPELRERYCTGRTDGLSPSRVSHVVRARVATTRAA